MKLKITRTKKTENVTVEYNRMTENRKETQMEVNFEFSDVSNSLIKFLKSICREFPKTILFPCEDGCVE